MSDEAKDDAASPEGAKSAEPEKDTATGEATGEGTGTPAPPDAPQERVTTPGSAKSSAKPDTPASKRRTSKPSTPTSKASAKSGGSAKSGRKTSSAAASKPPSAKSKSPSAKGSRASSVKGTQSPKPGSVRSPSPKPPGTAEKPEKGKAFKAPKKKVRKTEGEDIAEEEEGLPEGVQALFLASKTQEIFSCIADEHITEEEPLMLISKEKILQDLFDRAAVSDFSPIKTIIQEYPEDEILIGYDPDFKHGQNFFIATTIEARDKLIHPGGEEGEEAGEGDDDMDADVVYKYIPPVSKPWESLGSEKELADLLSPVSRPQIQMTITRVRREFGAPCQFADRNVAEAKDGYIECASYEDKTFDMRKLELETGTQAVPLTEHRSAQTDWKYPRNATTQYTPREFEEEERKRNAQTQELAEFMSHSLPRFELAMQQNDILDLFYDDWMGLADNDGSFGTKADTHLKEYQSFTDLLFSKEKMITAIDWHPTIRGIVAVSVAERLTFDERIEQAAKVIMTPSLILVWSFTDPIHPQLLLEAPDDILCFKFCPTDPNIIAGGCINGQLVLWDISAHVDKLKTQRGVKKKNALNSLPGFEDQSSIDNQIVRYCAVSSIEHSHRSPITDLLWMPDHMELNRMGIPQENTSGQCAQLMTCAVDHVILVWDTRPPKTLTQDKKQDKLPNPMGVPTTFKHLDLTWKPNLKVSLYKSEPGGDHSPCKFTIQEVQGDKSALGSAEEQAQMKEGFVPGVGGYGKPGSGKKTLKSINTHFYVGSEDGEIVYVDWMPQKDQDTGKIQTPKPDFYHTVHDGPVNTLQRSPFFRNILLSVGGWNFAIWKEGVTSGPILCSNASSKRLTSGHWSPSRPAVFYITKNDGTVDVWDLLDRTHEPSMTQNISSTTISYIVPHQVSSKQHLLAVGDGAGTLHILEIPWSLKQPVPNEQLGVSNYFDREVKRRGFVMIRWDMREREKIAQEAEAKMKAGIAPQVVLTDEEIEHRQRMEYQAYLDDESSFLRELGLKEDPEEPLPSTD